MKTSKQVSAELGVTRRSISRWCARLSIEKVGRDYLLTNEDIEKIKEVYRTERGRPKG